MFRINDSVEGARVAAAMPRSARAAISMAAVVESAARIEPIPNARAPASNRRRRPIRSPRLPIHRDEESGQQETIDVDHPQQLWTAGPQRDAYPRYRQVEDC